MALKDDIKLLSSVPLFSSMSTEQLKLIAFGAERMRAGEGEVLFHAGDQADCAYVVVSGRIALSQRNRLGEDVLVSSAASGTLLSELAMISNVERKYLAVVKEDSELLKITRTLFYRLLEEYPEVGSTIEDRIRGNLQTMTREIEGIKHRFV